MVNEKERMICIHSHVLYGVDDGAEDFHMAKMMLLYARNEGIYRLFATPHCMDLKQCPEAAEAAFGKLTKYLQDRYPDMALYPGCEVYCEGPMMDRVLQDLDSGIFPTLNHTRYVLTELSPWTDPEDALRCVEALRSEHYIPVLAHLERYQALKDNLELVKQLRDLGAKVQVNVGSLYDGTEDPAVLWARALVLEQLVDFLGTDCHKTAYRPPSAEMGLGWLREMVDRGVVSREYAEAITWKNAETLLIGQKDKEVFR